MNPNLNAFLTQLKLFLIVMGTLLAEQGMDHTTVYKWIMFAAGAVLVVGNAAWALWASYENWRKAAAVGVQAGINLTASGKALAEDGETVVSVNNGSTPPKPVTVETAAQIVKDFAPATPIAKS